MNYRRFIKSKLLPAFFCALFAFVATAAALFFPAARGAEEVSLSLFNPSSELEYFGLTAPISACYWQDRAAVVQSDGKLFIYSDNGYSEYERLTVGNPHQIRKMSSDKLLVSDNENLYTVNLNDLSEPAAQFMFGTEPVSGRCFDVNGSRLITISGTTIFIYTIENDVITSKATPLSGYAKINTPVCMNDNNEIFYINDDSALCKYTLSDATEKVLVNYAPETMAADEDYVYFSSGSSIYKVPVGGGESTLLKIDETPYALGKLTTPTDISFKGKNLLITDSSVGAVQEFSINGKQNSLEFTGFAIAKNKTAFNRTGANNVNVEKYGDVVAVLDDYKLTLIHAADGDKVFENCLKDELGGNLPNDFTLGSDTALLTYRAQSSIRFLVFDGNGARLCDPIDFASDFITDVAYSGGKYYLSLSRYDGSNFKTAIYLANEKDVISAGNGSNSFTQFFSLLFETDEIGANPIICADVDGNVYAADNVDALYFFNAAKNFEKTELPSPVTSSEDAIIKLASDLNGDLFVLTKSSLWQYVDGEKHKIDISIQLSGGSHVFSSFAMNFDKKTVYFTLAGEETLFFTDGLPNAAISAVPVPEGYAINGASADINDLKIYTVVSGANVYSVDAASNGFYFKGLTENVTELVLVNDELENPDFYVLAGESDAGEITVLVNKKWLTEKEVLFEPRFTEAFVSTDVSMYYLPIITRNDVFCLFDGEEIIRLDKKTPFNLFKTFVFLGREFYYAAAEVNGTSVSGYIPANFTVFRLAEDYIRENYTFEKVIATEVTDENGVGVFNLEDGATVRLYSQKDGLSYISYKDGEEWRYGFIDSSAIQKTPNTVIRNVAVIFLVTLSVCITSIYFVLKKKKP